MKRLAARLGRLAPDLEQTVIRFPLAALLLVVLTIVGLLVFNEIALEPFDERWTLLMVGLAVGALTAVAGTLQVEGRGRRSLWTHLAEWVLPLGVVALFQVRNPDVFDPWFIPLAVALWLALSPSLTQAQGRGANLFWWWNSRAIPSAIIAVVAGMLIVLGLWALNWSLTRLFTLELSWLFERGLLPLVCLLLIPLYWLSTLPHQRQFTPIMLSADDFLVRAVSFIGQFVLIPFALLYALIVHAYVVQIALTGALPDGVIGRLVLALQIAGFVTFLLVHPAFLGERPIVWFFQKFWFWLSIVPLTLFAYAVWVRIDAYGLTGPRVLVVVFGIWAIGLCALYLLTRGRADIRIIPGLAAALLVVISFGPTTPDNVARWHQLGRLDAMLAERTMDDALPQWTDRQRRAARAAFDFLVYDNAAGDRLQAVLAEHGIVIPPEGVRSPQMRAALGISEDTGPRAPGGLYRTLRADLAAHPVDLAGTPYFLGDVWVGTTPRTTPFAGLMLTIEAGVLTVARDEAELESVDLSAWSIRQGTAELITDPLIDLALGNAVLRLVVRDVTYRGFVDGEGPGDIVNLSALVFASSATAIAPDPPEPDR